ncbi:hypothetical protein BKA80DRAFT_276546 [Phyllosticta citrichinensis]
MATNKCAHTVEREFQVQWGSRRGRFGTSCTDSARENGDTRVQCAPRMVRPAHRT